MKYYLKERLRFFKDKGILYDEAKNIVYKYDHRRYFSPVIDLYKNDEKIGCVQTEFSLSDPIYTLYYGDKKIGRLEESLIAPVHEFILQGLEWTVKGDMFSMKYDIYDEKGEHLVNVSQQPFDQKLCMCIDIENEEKEELIILCVMAVYQYQKQRRAALI